VLGGLTFVDAAKVREGWSANRLLSQNVTGADDKTIGEVHDLVFDEDGALRALIVEGGGILDIGDALFRVPVEQLDLSRAPEDIRTSLKKEDVKKQGLYERPYQVEVGKGEFLGTQVFRNNVFLPQANISAQGCLRSGASKPSAPAAAFAIRPATLRRVRRWHVDERP
jgi:hypothetical protein